MHRHVSQGLLVVLLVSVLLPTAMATPRVEHRTYALGVGVTHLPLCGGTGSVSVLGVCFAVSSQDTLVSFSISEDVRIGSAVGMARFLNATGVQVGASAVFCNASPSLLIPSGAVAAYVVLGPLPHAGSLPGCLHGAALSGVVTAHFF